jgi:hypothetical protein
MEPPLRSHSVQVPWPFTKIGTRQLSEYQLWNKTRKGDQFTWAGMWEGRPIRFVTEPKLADKGIHFRTSSNARIHFQRDLGPCYVEIRLEPGTRMDPESRERFRAFAQQYDSREIRIK